MATITQSQPDKFNLFMSYLITFTIGLLAGFSAGLLVFRKHREVIDSTESKARKAAADLLKR
jgi:hypothetical protein